MSRDVLGEALREALIPIAPDVEERGRRVVEAAFDQRQGEERIPPERRLPSLPRLALGLALATLVAALLLSPAGADVRDWVDDAFTTTTTPRPEPALAEIPGGGRLLVQSAAGPWVVQPDGSRRLLGDYEEATWSPRGLFVAVATGRTLTAVEPDATPRWSFTVPARVSDPRWSPSPGERLAYRSGKALRVIAGDGTGDLKLAERTAPFAPAWSPFGDPSLAYVSGRGVLRIVNSENARRLAGAPALPGVAKVSWAPQAGRYSKSPRLRCACVPSGPGSCGRDSRSAAAGCCPSPPEPIWSTRRWRRSARSRPRC